MIEFVTVWVLTVSSAEFHRSSYLAHTYQLQFATQYICEKQRKRHVGEDNTSRCDFQQLPVWKNVK
jgi:hypothetical protein